MKRLAAALLCALAVAAHAADVSETLAAGYKAYLEGRLDDAEAAYRYLSTLGVGGAETDGNLALIARDKGDRDAALPLWVKATLEDSYGFMWDQRGWAYLADGRPKEARESFLKAIDRSTTTATQAEANLGLGLAALARSEPKAGMDPLRNALVQGPYAMAAASYETALLALATGDKQAALAYLRQGLSVDPLSLETLRALAHLNEKIGQDREAWADYAQVAALDPNDPEAPVKLKKLAQFIPGDAEANMAARRLARPLLDPSAQPVVPPAASTPTLRVALFTDITTGEPATATQAYFMVNTNFKILDAGGQVVKEDGQAYDQWSIEYRPESDLVELRDASRNIQYTTKTPFTIVPQDREGSVLLKSAKFVEVSGFDRGDRELRGVVEGRPTPSGFKLVNQVPLEDYLYGAVGANMPEGAPAEAYKAQAVVSRTLALWYKSQRPPNMEHTDICDSRHCQRYLGVNEEMRDASKAVADTDGLVLTRGGRLARAMETENCGGFTESGASTGDPTLASLVSTADGPGPAAPSTPLQLERFVHEFPARERYCQAQTLTAPSESRWIRLLGEKELQERADRVKPVGTLQQLRVLRRSATGRVLSMEVLGTRGSFTVQGFDQLQQVLSPGSLRSTLFTILALPRNEGPVQWILWGAGTGQGLGMCRAGAIGQAVLGRTYEQILAVYFPGYGVESPRGPRMTGLSARGKRLPLNPRYRSKPRPKAKKKPAAKSPAPAAAP